MIDPWITRSTCLPFLFCQSEQAQIEKLPEAERRQARMALLKQECHYLSSIEQLKIIADEHNRESRIEKFLETAAAPRQWKNDAYDLKVWALWT